MSKRVQGITQIKNVDILKKILENQNTKYKIHDHVVSWGEGYSHIEIDLQTGEVQYDQMYGSTLAQIKRNYSEQFLKTEILKKGHKIESIKQVGECIEIIANY